MNYYCKFFIMLLLVLPSLAFADSHGIIQTKEWAILCGCLVSSYIIAKHIHCHWWPWHHHHSNSDCCCDEEIEILKQIRNNLEDNLDIKMSNLDAKLNTINESILTVASDLDSKLNNIDVSTSGINAEITTIKNTVTTNIDKKTSDVIEEIGTLYLES